MAIATRRLQDPVAPPAATLRRTRLDPVQPAGADSRDAHRRVMEAAVEAADVAATIDAIARIVRAEAVLQDPFLAVVASSAAPATDIALTRSGDPLVRDLLRPGGSGGPGLVELSKHGSIPARLVARITARGELLGFLVVASTDRVAYATLEAAGPVLALLLQAEDRLVRLLDRDQRELFLDLLAGRSADCLAIQGRRLGHDLEQPHWPIVLRPLGAGPADTDDDATPRLEQIVRDILRDDRPAGRPAPIVGVDGDDVVVFLPDHGGDPGVLTGRIRHAAAGRGLAVTGGWGPRCDRLDAYGTGVARARWVVDVLAGIPGDAAPTGYDDLGIYALLYEKRDRDQLADFAARWLGPLLDHGDLTHTLRVLLETGGPSAAATALFVHISTLKYRLRKIQAILDADLSDPEVCFNLRLAFKIVAVHERLTGSSV